MLSQGFGGRFGVQNDRMDKSALSFKENTEKPGTNYTKVKPDIGMLKLKHNFDILVAQEN